MNFLLIDPHSENRDFLKSILSIRFPEWNLLQESTGFDLLQKDCLPTSELDLIISQARIGEKLLFDQLSLGNKQIPIVLIHEDESLAIQSHSHFCLGYLLSPLSESAVIQIFQKIRMIQNYSFSEKSKNWMNRSFLKHSISEVYKKRFLAKVGNKYVYIPVESIAYFYSDQGITYLVEARSSSKYIVEYSLLELESKLLDPFKFYRINRSIIVHLDGLVEIKPYLNGRLSLTLSVKSEEALVVARERVPEFKSWLDQ